MPPLAPRVVSLPLDIILLILDAVKELDDSFYTIRETLCSCALTCRAMLRPSQVRLYADVFISGRREFEGFGQALLRNPELASMVKELYTSVYAAWHAVLALQVDKLPLPLQAIGGMTNLRKLTVGGLGQDPDREMCSALLENFIGSFSTSCRQIKFLRLQSLEFQTYADFLYHVTAFPAVETLELDSVTWRGPSGSPFAALDTAEGCCAGLHSLKISLYKHRRPFWDFNRLPPWGSTVQSLTMHIPYKTVNVREFAGLSTFSHLRHFEIYLANNDIRSAPAALRQLRSENIKTVRIVHEARMRGYIPTLYERLGFDEILSEPPYMSLTRFTWCLLSGEPDVKKWFRCLPKCFSRLAKRNILVCELQEIPASEWRIGLLLM
ncbi:hypothetical protein K466DRAFT_599621 [Polyporus arcularius HHB13444]|uniref:F-box domain-containing protein n=1 Tax=Polyporus arcularius HHB13444 TaxID=1314778 RepID=A0A5C3PEB2_9APHY|nr:hypothetical protein K466DRAFT_599621 [Polyporus arcularius HHB13444]